MTPYTGPPILVTNQGNNFVSGNVVGTTPYTISQDSTRLQWQVVQQSQLQLVAQCVQSPQPCSATCGMGTRVVHHACAFNGAIVSPTQCTGCDTNSVTMSCDAGIPCSKSFFL